MPVAFGLGVRSFPESVGALPGCWKARKFPIYWPGPPSRPRGSQHPREARMAFSKTKSGTGVTLVRVEGQLIVGNRQELKALIQEALEAGDRRFLIDCSATGYIDSSGLGALVTISKKV